MKYHLLWAEPKKEGQIFNNYRFTEKEAYLDDIKSEIRHYYWKYPLAIQISELTESTIISNYQKSDSDQQYKLRIVSATLEEREIIDEVVKEMESEKDFPLVKHGFGFPNIILYNNIEEVLEYVDFERFNICPHCESILSKKADVCPNCNNNVYESTKENKVINLRKRVIYTDDGCFCPYCKSKVKIDHSWCRHCGNDMTPFRGKIPEDKCDEKINKINYFSLKVCPNCNTKIDSHEKKCPSCGHDFLKNGSKSLKICVKCGKPNLWSNKFCKYCGFEFNHKKFKIVNINENNEVQCLCCGNSNPFSLKKCSECGYDLEDIKTNLINKYVNDYKNLNLKICPSCGRKLGNTVYVCSHCSHDFRKTRQSLLFSDKRLKKRCGLCGTYNELDNNFCERCGNDISQIEKNEKSEIKKEYLGKPILPDEKICPNCGEVIVKKASFCTNCGFNLSASLVDKLTSIGDKISCPYCGKRNRSDYNYCERCGYNLLDSRRKL